MELDHGSIVSNMPPVVGAMNEGGVRPLSDSKIMVLNRPCSGRTEPFSGAAIDKDLQCPICMATMKDAFLTSCGHTFCYSCVTTHLNNQRNCPSCRQFLTHDQLFPNFLLNKVTDESYQNMLPTVLILLSSDFELVCGNSF